MKEKERKREKEREGEIVEVIIQRALKQQGEKFVVKEKQKNKKTKKNEVFLDTALAV